jgi:hypothetical protein
MARTTRTTPERTSAAAVSTAYEKRPRSDVRRQGHVAGPQDAWTHPGAF